MQAYIQYVDCYFKVNKTIRCKVLGKKNKKKNKNTMSCQVLTVEGQGCGVISSREKHY